MTVGDLRRAIENNAVSTLWLVDGDGHHYPVRTNASAIAIKFDLNGVDDSWQVIAINDNGDILIDARKEIAPEFALTEEGVYDPDYVLSGNVYKEKLEE